MGPSVGFSKLTEWICKHYYIHYFGHKEHEQNIYKHISYPDPIAASLRMYLSSGSAFVTKVSVNTNKYM